jgi:hypothetical protein
VCACGMNRQQRGDREEESRKERGGTSGGGGHREEEIRKERRRGGGGGGHESDEGRCRKRGCAGNFFPSFLFFVNESDKCGRRKRGRQSGKTFCLHFFIVKGIRKPRRNGDETIKKRETEEAGVQGKWSSMEYLVFFL